MGGGYTYIKNSSQLIQNSSVHQSGIDKFINDDFLYTEKTPFIYFSMNKEFSPKLSAKAGLRYEHTSLKGISISEDSIRGIEYGKLFPTIYLLYNSSKMHSISVSYSKRIERPSF